MLSDQAIFSLLQYAFLGRWRAQGEGKLEENIVDWEILSSPSPQAYHDLLEEKHRKNVLPLFYNYTKDSACFNFTHHIYT